jgi:hypothetical protein
MSKKFNSRELLDQVINAQQLASGLYIITLTNGIYKVNSKMIVD